MFDMEYVKDIVKQNYIAIIGILFGIVSFVLSGVYVYFNKCESVENKEVLCKEELNKEETVAKTDTENTKIKVDIKGAVKKTGVYELELGSNIQDALALAGGVTSKGSTSNINLSKRLTDEMVIYVFTKDELKKEATTTQVVCEIPKCECETVEVIQCPDVNGNTTNITNNNDSQSSTGKVSINKGTVEELTTLDGIGESKALAIIEYRSEHGDFEKLEDLMNVSGIGEKAYEKIKDNITL